MSKDKIFFLFTAARLLVRRRTCTSTIPNFASLCLCYLRNSSNPSSGWSASLV